MVMTKVPAANRLVNGIYCRRMAVNSANPGELEGLDPDTGLFLDDLVPASQDQSSTFFD